MSGFGGTLTGDAWNQWADYVKEIIIGLEYIS